MSRRLRRILVGLAVVSFATSCGDETSSTATTSATTTAPGTVPTTVTAAPTTTDAPTTTTPATTDAPDDAPTTAPVTTVPDASPVVAVWPASDVVFDTPEEAAVDFIEQVFQVEALLGAFQLGDARSGEFEVLSPLDDDDPATRAPTGATLFLRQLGPGDGWFVLAAVSDGVSIDVPEFGDEAAAGSLVVTGEGRGFEGTVVVRAIVPGDPPTELDLEIAATDWQTPVPYELTLDLTGAATGDVVTIIARGDTGIAATGEFAALPVVIN